MARARLIGLAAALALVAPLTACSDTSVMHMQVGQCILLPEEKTATTVETTNCTSEHDAEVFYMTSVDDGDFPGEAALNNAAEKVCISNFKTRGRKMIVRSPASQGRWIIPSSPSP